MRSNFDIVDTVTTTKRLPSSVRRGSIIEGNLLQLRSCEMVVVGGYQDMVRRSLQFETTQDDLDEIMEKTQGGRFFNVENLADVGSRMIRPSTEYEDYISIDSHGWNAPRIRFVLEFVKNTGMHNMASRHVYVGYTDYVGVNASTGSVDPHMRLHITASLQLRDKRVIQNGRPETVSTLVGYDQIIRGDRAYRRRNAEQYRESDIVFRMTPSDVFMNIEDDDGWGDEDDIETHPTHSQVKNAPKKSRRSNLIGGVYLSDMFNASTVASTSSIGVYGSGDASRYGRMIDDTAEDNPRKDALFKLFGDSSDMQRDASCTWEELIEYFPEAEDDNVTRIVFPQELKRSPKGFFNEDHMENLFDIRKDETTGWNNFLPETLIATSISQQLPSLMMTELIRDIRFTCTNEVTDLSRGCAWVMGDNRRRDNNFIRFVVTGLSNEFMSDCLMNFKRRFERMIMRPLSNNHEDGLSVTIDARCDGDVFISIQLNGNQPIEYTMPVFADSQSSSVITSSKDHYNQFTRDAFNLVREITG